MDEIRLPKNIIPIHYDLWVKPNFSDFTFEGKVDIKYKADAPTSTVVVNTNDIKIESGNVADIKLVDSKHNKKTEMTSLEFGSNIPTEGVISLAYKGNLNDLMAGLYRTALKIGDKTYYAATSQLEATDARRMLPCWDEPNLKATFKVAVTYPKKIDGIDYVALCNTPIVSTKDEGELTTVQFGVTPIMSTYLLALIVGPFEYIEKSDGKRPVRVYTTPGKKELGRFALDFACKSLRYYEDYFKIDYPLEKMDLIAIPDFCNGAMENWGLVTYRETCILFDEQNSAAFRKQIVAIVVAHELAHQWFGNLVTMQWWTHLWLNEGFASFMEYLCTDAICPEFDIWSQFVSDAQASALSLDAMHNSHPIEVPVKNPSEINAIFDLISYEKGASVIRMLYNYIGDDAFRKGMNQYLTKFSYKNATTEDLWASLEAASDKPVTKMMSTWTSQMGYPWLAVSPSPMEGDKMKLNLTQSKFSIDNKNSEEELNMRWQVPVSTLTAADPKKQSPVVLFDGKTTEIVVDNVGDSWVKLNPGSIGFYRVGYTNEMLEKLSPAIQNKSLTTADRLNLHSDVFALSFSGNLEAVTHLKFLQSFKGETEYTVWSSIDGAVDKISNILRYTDFQPLFQQYALSLYTDIFKKLTWNAMDSEKHSDTLNRSLVINRLISFGDESVIQEGIKRFNAHISKQQSIPADLKAAVYRCIAKHGDDACYDKLFELYKESTLQEEKNRLCSAMAFSKDPNRLKKFIDFSFSGQVRDSDMLLVFSSLGQCNPDFAWETFKNKKAYFREKFAVSPIMPRMAESVSSNFATDEKAQEITKYFEENPFEQANRAVKQSVEAIRFKASWLSRESVAIKAFLTSLRLIK